MARNSQRNSFEPRRRDVLNQQRQENDFQQQALDQRGQDSMVSQLGQLYGISNTEAFNPLRMEQIGAQTAGMKANTAAQQIQNDWTPYNLGLQAQSNEAALARGRTADEFQRPQLQNQQDVANITKQGAQNTLDWQPYYNQLQGRQAEAGIVGKGLENQHLANEAAWDQPFQQQKFELGGAQIDATKALAGHRDEMNPAVIPYLNLSPEELVKLYAPPQIQASRAAEAVKDEAARKAGQAAHQVQQGAPTPQTYPDMASRGAAWGEAVGNSIMDMGPTAYNAVGGVQDFITQFLGLPVAHTSRMHSYSDRRAAQKRGTDYAGAFYNPRNPDESRPYPIAR